MTAPATGSCDVALVITGHRERSLAHHTFKAVQRCVRRAVAAGLGVEVVGVLDRADDETIAIFAEHLAPDGPLGQTCRTSLLEVSLGDPGLSRNAGIAHTNASLVGVLDADNLPSGNWLVEAVAVARQHGAPCVVHPESLVIFQGRTEVWPQPSSADAHVRPENFYDQNYWDTFCVATRDVFEALPYAPTPRDSGFGPEDWHWNVETIARDIDHLSACGTHLFYRVKREGSVQDGHRGARSLLAPARLLTDSARAAAVVAEARSSRRVARGRRPKFLRRLLRPADKSPTAPPPAALEAVELVRARVSRGFMVPSHYRYANPDLAALSDAELEDHFRSTGRTEGRRGWLTAAEIEALSPAVFDVAHYRALHADVGRLGDAGAVRHYLEHGRQKGYRARLTRRELRALRDLDTADYRDAHPDLFAHDDLALVQHYLEHGLAEGRRPRLTAAQRVSLTPADMTAVEDEMRALHEIEPWITLPGSASFATIGPPPDGSLSPGSRVWWQVVDEIGERRPDIVFFAPWIRMGGGDILLIRYANAVARLRPDLHVVVVTTYDDSTHTEQLSDDVRLVDLVAMPGYADLGEDEKRRLVATIVTQYAPRMVHAFNSPEFFDAVDLYPRALATSSRLFLSTFVIDRGPHGELSSHLARRSPGYLAPVSGVIVDNHALVEQFHDLYRFDRDRFIVHHQPVTLPPRRPWTPREPGHRLQVAWAARFDKQKRLDVLADVVEACREAGLPVDWHVYGAPVMDRRAESEEHLERLEKAGAQLHGTYATFTDLPLDELDLFLLTSETEGIPLTLLDVLAHRLPVMTPLVGGIPELISESTGWPIARFDDVPAYVEAIRTVAGDRDEAARRADAAYDLLAAEFAWDTFDRRLLETPGYLP